MYLQYTFVYPGENEQYLYYFDQWRIWLSWFRVWNNELSKAVQSVTLEL